MALIQLSSTDSNYKIANNNSDVRGTDKTDENVLVQTGVTGTKIASTIEKVDLPGAVADYKFKQGFGSNVEVTDAAGNVIMTLTDVAGKKLSFTDGTVDLTFAGGKVAVGGKDITTTAAAVVPTTIDTTDKSESGSGSTTATGQTFTLTNSTDVFTGTTATDTFTSASGTLQAADVLADGSTSDADVLNLTMNAYSAITASLSNIENINATGTFTTTGLDFTNVTNNTLTTFTTGITGGTATAANVGAGVKKVVMGTNIATADVTTKASGTGGETIVDFGASTTVKLAGSAASDDYSIIFNGTSTALSTGATGTIETLKISSVGGDSTLTLKKGDDLVTSTGTATITGDKSITIIGDLDDFGTTGTVTIANTLTSGALTIKTNEAASGDMDLKNVAADYLDVSVVTGANVVVVNERTTIKLNVDNDSTKAWDVNKADGSMANGTGTLKMEINADQSTEVLLLGVEKASTAMLDFKTANVTIDDLDTSDTDLAIVKLTGDKNVVIADWSHNANDVLSALELTGTLTVTGTSDFAGTIQGGKGNDSITVGGASFTILGGDGVDTLTGGVAADVLLGGKGNDTLIGKGTAATVGGAKDTLTGNEGNDTFRFSEGESDVVTVAVTDADAITDYTSGSDIIDFANSNIIIGASSAGAISGTAHISTSGLATFNSGDDTLAEKVDAVIKGIELGEEAQGHAAVFAHNGNSYVYIMSTAGAGATATLNDDDLLIEVTGVSVTTGLGLTGGDITSIA